MSSRVREEDFLESASSRFLMGGSAAVEDLLTSISKEIDVFLVVYICGFLVSLVINYSGYSDLAFYSRLYEVISDLNY